MAPNATVLDTPEVEVETPEVVATPQSPAEAARTQDRTSSIKTAGELAAAAEVDPATPAAAAPAPKQPAATPAAKAAAGDDPDDPDESDDDREARESRERDDKGRFKSGWQKRVDQLTRRNYSLEDQNRQLAERLARLEGRVEGEGRLDARERAALEVNQNEPEFEADEPRPTQFKSYDAYVRAHGLWAADRVVDERMKDLERTSQARQQRAIQQQYAERVKAAKAEYDDWDEVVIESDVPCPPAMQAAIMDSDLAGHVLHYLARPENDKEAREIAQLHPARMLRAIGRIEAKIERERAAKQRAAPETPTAATTPRAPKPKPVAPVAGNKAATSVDLSQPLDYQQWTIARNRQIEQAGGTPGR